MIKNTTKFKETEIGTIPEEWDVADIGNFCSNMSSGGTPSRQNRDYYKNGKICWIKTGELDDSYIYDTEEKITEDAIKNSSARIFPKNTVSLAMYGATVGKLGILGIEASTNQACCNMVTSVDSDFKFLFYSLLNKREELIGRANGAAQQNLSVGTIKSFKMAKPSLDEQKQIADILSSLDDKIELNRRINANLEKIASSLFKHWFVDFEFPDKNGKPYKSSGGKMIDSELGEIPEGWRVELLTNYVDIGKGLSYKGSDLVAEGKDVLVGLKCFERGGGFRADGTKRFAGKFKNQYLLHRGDLIIAMTDLTQGAEVLGKPAIVPNIKNAEHVVASLDVSILRPKNQQISKSYLYTLLMRQETQDYLFGYSNGSTVLHLSVKGLNEFKLAIAPNDIFQNFNNIIEPIFGQIQILNDEIINMSKVRDSLLPRLMNGKIRVK